MAAPLSDTVIDIAHYQKALVLTADYLAVIHKATQIAANTPGMHGGIDQFYAARKAQAKALGLLWGAYAFLDPHTSASGAAQADFFLKVVPADGVTLPVLDYEIDDLPTAEAFVQHYFDVTGIWVVLYTRLDLLTHLTPTSPLTHCSLWLADQSAVSAAAGRPVTLPPHFATWSLWQYGQRLTNGFSVDRDKFNGNAAELVTWWQNAAKPAVSVPLSPPPVVADTFQAPVGDGKLWSAQPVATPGAWFSANNYLNLYTLGSGNAYHTGVDLNEAGDADAHSAVNAAANGVITYAQRVLGSTWGNLIVERCTLFDGRLVYLRYAHVENVLVSVGDAVTRGQRLASVGNGFGTVPYHLHFDVSETPILNTSPTNWPGLDRAFLTANYSDPYVFLLAHGVATSVPPTPPVPVAPASVPRAGHSAVAVFNDNLRTAPMIPSSVIQVVSTGQTVKVTADPVVGGDWWWVKVTYADKVGFMAAQRLDGTVLNLKITTVTPPPVSAPGLPFSVTERGVHGSAGGWAPSSAELDLIRSNAIRTILLLTWEGKQAATAIPAYRSAGVQNFILRADAHEAPTTPQRFAQVTIPLVQEYVTALGTAKDVCIAIHNEPNIVAEGYGSTWQSGAEFATWWSAVAALYRTAFPGARLGFPALSPGGDVAGVRADEHTFASQALSAIARADWLGAHAYWQNSDGSDFAPELAYWKTLAANKPVVGTEIGPVGPAVVTAQAVQAAYTKLAAVGIPCCAWLLSGTGAFPNADWTRHPFTLPAPTASPVPAPGPMPVVPPPVITVPPVVARGGYGPHFKGNQASIPRGRPVYKSIDNADALIQAHNENPDAICIFRAFDPGPMDVIGWLAHNAQHLAAMPWAYFESFNEPSLTSDYFAFEAARVRALATMGRRACVLNSGVANMNTVLWLRAFDMLQATIEHDGLVGVHYYWQTVNANGVNGFDALTPLTKGTSGFDASGAWHGDLYPARLAPTTAWTGFRALQDLRDLAAQGQGRAVVVGTEGGCDDLSQVPGLYSGGGKVKGYRQCESIWARNGWVDQNKTRAQFYREQLDYWCAQTGLLLTPFTHGTGGDANWAPFDTTGDLYT